MKNNENQFYVNQIETQLQSTFYWMAKATEDMQKGDFNIAIMSLTTAINKLANCIYYKQSYLREEDISYKSLSDSALAQAKQEIADEMAE